MRPCERAARRIAIRSIPSRAGSPHTVVIVPLFRSMRPDHVASRYQQCTLPSGE